MNSDRADKIGRQLSIYLRKNQFDACHELLDDLKRTEKCLYHSEIEWLSETSLDLRTLNLLEKAGFNAIEDLRETTQKDLLEIPMMGRITVVTIRLALKKAREHNRRVALEAEQRELGL